MSDSVNQAYFAIIISHNLNKAKAIITIFSVPTIIRDTKYFCLVPDSPI